MDKIVRTIRERHQNDALSAPIASPNFNDKRLQRFLATIKIKTNPIEDFWRIFCEELEINYDKLSEKEHLTMKNMFKKSKLLKLLPNHKNKGKKK